MKNAPILVLGFFLALSAGCGSMDGGFTLPPSPGGGVYRTFNMPVARVKPAFVTTVVQLGMSIAAIETRGKNEVLKARRSDKSVEIEFESLGASSTRVRVTGSDQARIMSETEKRLTAG